MSPGVLADREVEVLRLLAEGLMNPAIGRRMGMTVPVADRYVRQVRTKLRARTRMQLILRGVDLGYLSPDGKPA